MTSPAPFEDITTSVLQQPAWVNKENKSFYDQSQWAYIASHPKRHVLGLVGGNEVSLTRGNVTDVESDLTRRTRPLTRCPPLEHAPVLGSKQQLLAAQGNMDEEASTTLKRQNRKYDMTLDVSKVHLPAYQMWAYPVVMAPTPLKADPCLQPHKY
jgi:hypothetical protein